jgi:hypothetical protein
VVLRREKRRKDLISVKPKIYRLLRLFAEAAPIVFFWTLIYSLPGGSQGLVMQTGMKGGYSSEAECEQAAQKLREGSKQRSQEEKVTANCVQSKPSIFMTSTPHHQ